MKKHPIIFKVWKLNLFVFHIKDMFLFLLHNTEHFMQNYWKFPDQSMEEILTLLSYNKAENKELIIYKNDWGTIWKYVIKHLTTLSMTSWYSRLNYLKISTTRKFIISTLQRLTRPSIVFIFYLISWYFQFFLTWQFHQDHFSFDKRKSERMVSN